MSRSRKSSSGKFFPASISRRDFVNGVLVGSGAALLQAPSLAAAGAAANRFSPSGSPWTGYGGVGDYAWSNGNTEAVRDAAHGIRDHLYLDAAKAPVDEEVDLLIVGSGFAGTTAFYEFSKHRKARQTCLVLENHPMFGGEAKQNEFDVDGQRLVGPQGSNGALVVTGASAAGYGGGRYEAYAEYYRELGLPEHYELEPLAGGAEKYVLPNDHYDPMLLESRFAAGYWFKGRGWARNPIAAQFKNTPWPVAVQKEMDDFANNRRDVISKVSDPDRWLDSMSYYDLLDRLGYGAEVRRYIDPLIGVGNFGVCGDAISAFAAKRLTLPGTIPSTEENRFANVEVVSFPGGNAAILRTMMKRILPDAIPGEGSVAAVARGHVDFSALDRPGADLKLRLEATVVRIEHEGPAETASAVRVTYLRHGKLHTVRAKGVVAGTGGWVTRNIVADLPEAQRAAYAQFRYGPVLTVNVALRNWRFFDRLGFTVARWFEGLGWHACVRRNVDLDGRAKPLTPDSPLVLTFYIPMLAPGTEPALQGSVGRARLLSKSYADFEREICAQMDEMFGPGGFRSRRDVAGVVLNRWGHAYFAPGPGFFFGRDGSGSPAAVLRRPHGRIAFAHSELQGNMNAAHAMLEGRRAVREILERI